jgi:hypothetical protein
VWAISSQTAERHAMVQRLISIMIENRKTKKCSICNFYKPLELFDKSISKFLNRRCECKYCRSQNRTDINTTAVKRAKRKYRTTKHGQLKEQTYNNSERHKSSIVHWNKKNPNKVHAGAVARRLYKIPKPCTNCKSTKNLIRHHPNYKFPKRIIWLCTSCHRSIHTASSQEKV